MSVVIKPGGVVLLICIFGIMAFFLLRHDSSTGKPPSTSAASKAPGNAEGPNREKGPSPRVLENTGFKSDYGPIVPYDNKAQLSGTVASPWVDDSSWAHVNVTYSEDKNNPHSGQTCQRIQIDSVERVKPEDRDVVQFSQQLALPKGKAYQGTFWLRADKDTEVEVALRQQKWPYHYYGAKVTSVGQEWKKVDVTATIQEEGDTFLMLKVWKSAPLTLWVDDAGLVETSGAKP